MFPYAIRKNGNNSTFRNQHARGPVVASVPIERDQPARTSSRRSGGSVDHRRRPSPPTSQRNGRNGRNGHNGHSAGYERGYAYNNSHGYQQQQKGYPRAILRRDLSNSSRTSGGSDHSNKSDSPAIAGGTTKSPLESTPSDGSESPILNREGSNSPALAGQTSPLSPPPNYAGLQVLLDDDEPRIGDGYVLPLPPSPASLIRPLTPVEPVTPRTSPLKSKRILFLDVDGVLLSAKCQQQMKEGQRIEFNPNMKKFMTRIAHETKCDIVVSSSWQFYPGHLQELNAFLIECGWTQNTIHTLMSTLDSDITRDAYEQAPYCQSRSRGIMKAIEKHSSSIENWVAIDDLPLASTQHVCVPLKDDLNAQTQAITDAYMNHIFSYFRDKENIRQWRSHVLEQVFHAMTVPAHGLFSWKSLLFGFELNNETVRAQATTVCDWVEITHRIGNPSVVQRIIETVMVVVHDYCLSHCGVQGYPHLREHFIQTDMNTGLTKEDVDQVIRVLNGRDSPAGKDMFQAIFSPRRTAPPSLGPLAEDDVASDSGGYGDNPFAIPRDTRENSETNPDGGEAN